jgi:hypothetical protein
MASYDEYKAKMDKRYKKDKDKQVPSHSASDSLPPTTSDNTLPTSAGHSHSFEEISSKLKEKYLTSSLDDKGVNDWFNEAKSIISNLQNSTASEYSTYSGIDTERMQYLLDAADDVRKYIRANKSAFKNYDDIFNGYTQLTTALDTVQKARSYFSQFKSEEEYNKISKGWETYLADKAERDASREKRKKAEEEAKANESFFDKLGRWLGGVQDTTLPTSTVSSVTNDMAKTSAEEAQLETLFRFDTDNYTEEQKEEFGRLYVTDKQAAAEYAKAIELGKYEEFATKNFGTGLLATLGSVLSSPITGMADYLTDIAEYNARGAITTKEASPFEYSQAGTQAITKDLNEFGTAADWIPVVGGKGWGDVYGLGTSIAQSWLTAATGGGLQATVSFFGSAAASAVDDALARGASDSQAINFGFVSGVAEAAAEYLPTEMLLGKGGNKGIKAFFKGIRDQMIAEGIEEGATSLLTNIADNIIIGENSQFNKLVEAYMQKGLTQEEATRKAWAKTIEDIAFDALAGAVSGGISGAVFSGGSYAFDRFLNTEANKNAVDTYGESSQELLGEALEIGDADAKKYAEKLQKKLDGGKSLSGYEIRKMVEANDRSIEANDVAEIKKKTAVRLAELGEEGEVDKLAGIIAKKALGESLTHSEKATLDKSKYGTRVSNELDPNNIKAGTYSSAWTDSITTNRINDDVYGGWNNAESAAPKTSTQEASPEVLKGDHKVSESGNTVYVNEDGEAENVSIKKIVSTEGDVKVELDNGKTVSVKDLELSSDAEAMAFEMVTRMETTPETAQVIFEAVKASNATSVQELFIGVPTAYRYGKINYEAGLKGISIPNAIKRLAFERGRVDATPTTTEAQQTEQKATDAKGVTSQKKGNVIFEGFKYSEDSATDMQKASMAGINVLAKMSSLEIHVYASWVENGKRYAMVGGKKRVAPNGWHEEGTNKIYIDINAGNNGEGAMLYTLGHEVTHHIANWNWDGFKKLGDFLIENFSKNNVPVDILIERKKQTLIKSYKRDGKAVPGDNQLFMEAYEEVVAEAMTSMFTDPKAYEKLAELKKQDKTLWQKLGEAIKKMLDKLKSLLGVYDNAKPGAREADFVAKFSKDVYEQLQDLYLKAFVEADANYQAAQRDGTANKHRKYEERASDTDSTADKINHSMTMAEAKRMLESAFKVNGIAEYYEGEYKDAVDWLRKAGSDEVQMYIENDFDLHAKYINSNEDILNEEYQISDVLDAYLAGTLVGKEKPKAKRLDVSKSTRLKDDRFYSPQKIEDAQKTFELAKQRAVGNDVNAIIRARAEILLFAHNKGAAELLGITQAELNKKLRSWSKYSATAKNISQRINAGVAEENRWTGIENSSYISKARVSVEDIERLVSSVEGDSRGYERKYIARVMLAADTHIDYSGLKLKFGTSQQVNDDYGTGNRVLGFYDDTNRIVEVTHDKPHTVAHEMGHYIDAQWGRDLLGINSSHLFLTRGINEDMVRDRHGEQGVQFLKNFKIFMDSLTDVNSNSSGYTNNREEVFARFFARFVEWTDNIATGNRYYSYESGMYGDKFTQAQFVEFARLLQEKALLDGSVVSSETSADNNVSSSKTEIMREIKNTKSGGSVVWIEDDVLKGNKLPTHQAVANYLAQHIGEVYTIIESGQKVYLGKDLPSEYTQSVYTKALLRNPGLLKAKNKALPNLGEMIEIATNRRWSKDKGSGKKDAKYGVYKYDTRFAFPVRDSKGNKVRAKAFDATLVIINSSDGKKYLYDLISIKENTSVSVELSERESIPARKQVQKGSVSAGIIAQDPEDVKRNFSEREIVDISNNDYVKMYHHFGSTKNYDVAGYILGNGVMLDFSGKHWGDDYSTSRQVDHRDVQEVLDDRGNNGINAMIDMIGNGNIRLMPEVGGINLAVKPNSTQMSQLRGYINHFKGEIVVDIDKVGGDTIHSFEYTRGTSSSKILADIKAYFDEGIVPKQKEKDETDIRQFHYSERTYSEGLSEEDKAIADKVIKNLKIRAMSSKYGITPSGAYTAERMEREIKTSSSDTVSDYAKSYITWVTPIDFIYATTTSEQVRSQLHEEAGELDVERLAKERQPIHLTVDFDTGEIIGHEGRHRMLALRDAGIARVAVIIDAWNDNRHQTKPIEMMHLQGQRFGEYKQGTDFFLHDMLPLSQRYADVAREVFSHDPKGGVRFQERDPDSISNRSLLANALESAVKNDIERNKLAQYKSKLAHIESEQAKLADVRQQAHDLRFKKGRTEEETKNLRGLDFEANQIANRINTYDRQLFALEATAALKGVLEREKQMAYKRAEQKGKEALKKQRERASENYKKLLAEKQESRKNAIESRHKTEMRHKIKKVVGDLNNLLLHPTKDNHVPIGLQLVVADALDAINMDTMNAAERVAYYNDRIAKSSNPDEIEILTKKRDFFEYREMSFKDKVTALKNAYEEFKNSDDPLIKNAHNDAIVNLIENTSDVVGKKSLKDMSYEQLEAVYNMYKAVLATVRNANKMFKEGRQETVTENSESVKTEVRSVGGHQDRVLKATKFLKKFGWDMLKPITALKVIGSDTLASLFDNVRAGEDTWAVDVSEAKEFYKNVSTKYGYKDWDFKKRYSFKDGAGHDFSLSLEQIMSLYAYSKRDQADRHLEVGGFIFDDAIEVTEKTKVGIPMKYEVNDANPYRLRREDLLAVIDSLSNEQKGFIDEMQSYLSDVMGAKGNEVSLAMYDIKLYNEKNYFPLKTSRYFREFDPEKSATPKIKNAGFSKKTVPQAGNPIVLSNFMDVWASHVNDMSMYHAFVLPLEDFTRVYNYSSTAGGYDSVQQYIKNAYGAQANQYVERLLDDLNGGARVDSSAGVINKGLSLFKKASVFASASVVVQQPSAIARAFAYVNPKYFAATTGSALNIVNHKELWAEVKKYAPVAVIKEMGYFDTGIGRSSVDWIKGNQTIMDKVDDALAKAPAIADELSWAHIWLAVKREVKATTNLKEGSEEFLKKAGKRFTEVIVNTQVYDSVLSRSGMMRSKDTGMKMATAFMAEPTTAANMMINGIIQGKRGNKKFLAATVGGVSASIVLNSILVALVYGARDDDEDETYAEKYLGSLTSELLDGFNPLTYIPFVKDIWSIAQGYDVERSDMTVVSNLWESIERIFNENTSGWDKVADVSGAVSSLFGIPLKNIIRDAKGLYNLFATITSGVPTTKAGVSDAVEDAFKSSIPLWDRLNDSKTNADRLYEAIVSGDQAQIDRIKGRYKDEDAVESAIRKALRENDPRIKEAAQADFDGDVEEYDRIINEIIREGNFDKDDILAAVKSERNGLEPEDEEDDSPAADKEVSIYTVEHYFTAIKSGKTSLANSAKDDIIKTAVANGKSMEDAESAFYSSFRNHAKKVYAEGGLTRSEAERMLIQYGNREEDDAYWDLKEWDYFKQNGTEDGYSKYNNFYEAVRTGRNLKAVIKEYTSHGVEAQTLASRITTYFKPLYVNMSNSERAKLKGYLLNAYVQLGYSRAEKMKDINDWLKDKD